MSPAARAQINDPIRDSRSSPRGKRAYSSRTISSPLGGLWCAAKCRCLGDRGTEARAARSWGECRVVSDRSCCGANDGIYRRSGGMGPIGWLISRHMYESARLANSAATRSSYETFDINALGTYHYFPGIICRVRKCEKKCNRRALLFLTF